LDISERRREELVDVTSRAVVSWGLYLILFLASTESAV